MDCRSCGATAADDRQTGYVDDLCPECRALAEDDAPAVPENWEEEHERCEEQNWKDEPLDIDRELEDEDYEKWRDRWQGRRQ